MAEKQKKRTELPLQLIEKLTLGDLEDTSELLEDTLHPAIRRFAIKSAGGNNYLAHEAALVAIEKISVVCKDRDLTTIANPTAYLLQVAHNGIRDYIRSLDIQDIDASEKRVLLPSIRKLDGDFSIGEDSLGEAEGSMWSLVGIKDKPRRGRLEEEFHPQHDLLRGLLIYFNPQYMYRSHSVDRKQRKQRWEEGVAKLQNDTLEAMQMVSEMVGKVDKMVIQEYLYGHSQVAIARQLGKQPPHVSRARKRWFAIWDWTDAYVEHLQVGIMLYNLIVIAHEARRKLPNNYPQLVEAHRRSVLKWREEEGWAGGWMGGWKMEWWGMGLDMARLYESILYKKVTTDHRTSAHFGALSEDDSIELATLTTWLERNTPLLWRKAIQGW